MQLEKKDNNGDKEWIISFLRDALKSEKHYKPSNQIVAEIIDEWLDDVEVNTKQKVLSISFVTLSGLIRDAFGLTASKQEKAAWLHTIWAAIKAKHQDIAKVAESK